MYNRYLITGATGFLGRAIVEELVRRNVRVDALVLHDDPYAALLPEKVRTVIGDTVLKNYPLYCPKCKQETLIEAENLKVTVIKKQEN